MIKKLVILSVIVFIIGAIYLFFQKKQGINNTSGWPWKEYPRNFLNVDCNTVPTSAAARPGSDIMQNLRSICWQDRAWYENKWEFCNNLDDFWADHCLEWMAIKLKDNNICKSQKVKDVQNCNKLLTETSSENTWHFKDYINKGLNPL